MLKENEQTALQQLVDKAKTKIKTDYGVDIKTEIKIDTAKTLAENKAFIMQSIIGERDRQIEQVENAVNTSKKEKDKLEAEAERKNLETLKEKEKNIIAEWKKQFNPSMVIKSPAYFEMEKYLEMVCAGFSNFCIVHSEGGLAKTWSSQAILKKHKIDYAYLNSFTSPLELYNFLYDNSKGKVILIDDTEGIWDNKAIISILKNATELNGERTISWNSSTGKLQERSRTCKFDSRIILLTNQLPNAEKNPHIQALLSRGFLAKLRFSYQEKLDVIQEVSKKKYQNLKELERQEIYAFLIQHTNEATKELSIRTLIKLYHFYLFDKTCWKELGMRLLKADVRKQVVIDLMKTDLSVNEQVKDFNKKCNGSRATFFRLKQELIPKGVE